MTNSTFNFGLLIEAEDLLPHLGHEQLRIVDLSRRSVYEQLHLPQAIHVKPNLLVQQQEHISGLLPEIQQLQELIKYLNLSANHHVVVYDDEGGAWAGRLIWNLYCVGFKNVSLLNGGIHAWLALNYPISSTIEPLQVVDNLFEVQYQTQYRIEFDQLLEKVQNQQIQLWDCRTEDEYTGLRQTARRAGHIPHAIHFEWSTALNRQNHLKLHSLTRIQQRLEQQGFDLTRPVVVYCQSHHRSGLAFVIGRLLNWQIQAYDGAWSEWGNRLDSPIISGEFPT